MNQNNERPNVQDLDLGRGVLVVRLDGRSERVQKLHVENEDSNGEEASSDDVAESIVKELKRALNGLYEVQAEADRHDTNRNHKNVIH